MGSVALSGIRKSFGTVEVLHGVDIDVKDGEFVVLVGPSGCGKSTLLRTLAGLEAISAGDIQIDGESVTQLHPKKRNIAMVFQNYALYPNMTVAQNMSFSLKMAKVAKAESDQKVANAAAILELEDLLHRYPRQLSGGQRQRVAMGRAIVRDPSVFLFDEPLSNLDAKLRVQMRSEIKQLHQRLGTTIVYVTHDQIEAMTMADRIVVMRDGYVEQVGTPREVYSRPANLFVAGFIGSPAMNMIDANVSGGQAVIGDGVHLPVPSGIADGAAITLGIRPEDLLFAGSGLPATVRLVEPTGADTLIVLDLAGTLVTVDTREEVQVKPGQRVHLSVADDKTHVFDAKSGSALRPHTGS